MRFYIHLPACSLLLVTLLISEARGSLDQTHCPPATCADGFYDPKTSCYSCEESQCMLRGCVHSGAFFTTWMPDNCTVCQCLDKEKLCTTIECAPLQCYGYPTVHRSGKCCPECDFNVSKYDCGAVPVATKSLYVSLGDETCRRDVLEYACDKHYIIEDDGEWFACEPVREEVTQSFADVPGGGGCGQRISHMTYKAVARCEKRRLSDVEIPQDYDPEPHRCHYYVDPQTPGEAETR